MYKDKFGLFTINVINKEINSHLSKNYGMITNLILFSNSWFRETIFCKYIYKSYQKLESNIM